MSTTTDTMDAIMPMFIMMMAVAMMKPLISSMTMKPAIAKNKPYTPASGKFYPAQGEWTPWSGERQGSASGLKTTRTSPGPKESTHYAEDVLLPLQTGLGVDLYPLRKFFSDTDRQPGWRKVEKHIEKWDPEAWDQTWNKKGALVTEVEKFSVPPHEFVERWNRSLTITRKSEANYRILAQSTARPNGSGAFRMMLFASPKITTGGILHLLREEPFAMMYKKDMTLYEAERKVEKLTDILYSLK